MHLNWRALTVVVATLLASSAASPASAQSSDIVLYASDVSMIAGNWARLPSTTGAGGQKMTSVDKGWSSLNAPLAAPADHFEASFTAPAGVAYRVWLRLRGAADSKYNESVWVQWSDAVTSSGAALWRVGSTSGLLVNLEDCRGCGVSGWGWQDNAYWLGTSSIVRFAASGTHTIRVQTREDGVDVDQIVLSPSTYLNSSPGLLKNDTTIVPKSGTTPSVTLVRPPYVQQVSDRDATVVWTTRESGAAEVRFGTSSLSNTTVAQSRVFLASTTGLPYDFYQHEATLSGLAAATRYNFDVFVGGVDATPGTVDTFRTAPLTGSGTVTFVAFGDSGTGSTEQRQLASRIGADTFDLALHAGDVVYGTSTGIGGASYPQYDNWFFNVYATWLRSHPVFPSIGNHDNEIAAARAYRDVFVLPDNGASAAYPDHAERYYSFDYGPIHFVVLDTETAFLDTTRRQAQLDWLRADLSSTAQVWKVGLFHRPPYSSGTEHGSDLTVRAAFAPIFEQYGVQLVLNGHDHDYERSKPWRQYTSDGQAVTYVVTGGGGGPLYTVGTNAWTAFAQSAYHYVRVTAGTGCTLTVSAIKIDGTTMDRAQIDRCATPPPSAGTPLPGTLQAEDFDAGANGTAYYDQTAGNTGGQYRATDVDIERTTDTGGGYDVGWIGAGEWLTYTVNVASAGSYTLGARVASPSGASMHVEIDGVNATGPLAVPATGGWQAWTTVTKGLTLAAGTHVMKVVFDTAGLNVNYIRVAAPSSTPYGGTPRAVPGTIQSEDFDEGGEAVAYHDNTTANSGGQYRATGVDVERTGDTGGGYDVGWAGAGEWLNYTVSVATAGTYQLTARVASPGTGGTFHVEADGVDVTGAMRVPATGGWQTYQNVTIPVTLNAGAQVLRVVLDTNGASGAVGNFNYILLK